MSLLVVDLCIKHPLIDVVVVVDQTGWMSYISNDLDIYWLDETRKQQPSRVKVATLTYGESNTVWYNNNNNDLSSCRSCC